MWFEEIFEEYNLIEAYWPPYLKSKEERVGQTAMTT